MAGEVEFLPEEFDDEGAGSEGWPSGPRRVVWRVAAVVIALAALAVIVLAHPTGKRPPTAFVPPPTPSATASSSAPAPPALKFASRVVRCPIGTPVQTDIVAAMGRYLPKIVINNPMSYRCTRGIGVDQRIVFETVTGSYGRLVITVEMTTPMPDGVPDFRAAPVSGTGVVRLGRVVSESVGLKVAVSASGRRGTTAPLRQMRQLAEYLGENIRL